MTPEAPLGIIELANRPLQFMGCVGNADSFPYPVLYETAKDAYVSRIVAADPALGGSYCEAALRLRARGAKAIISSCGFAVIYQQAVAAQVSLPVLMSSLLLLPLILTTIPQNKRVAVLTYDSRKLDTRFLRAGGVHDDDIERIVIAGIEDSASWLALGAPEPDVKLSQLREDVLALAERTLGPTSNVGAILLECSAFCPFADEIRMRSGLPVSDLHTLADLAIHTARGRG